MDIHDFIREQKKDFGPRLDFWYPKQSGAYLFRLYRVGGELFSSQDLHELTPWTGGQRRMTEPCTMKETGSCTICEQVQKLFANKDKDSVERAKQLRRKTEGDLVGVLTNEPDKWKLWGGHSYGRMKEITHLIAQEGGFYDPVPTAEQPEKVQAFIDAFKRGADLVCGPNGRDLVVIYTKGQKPSPYRFNWSKQNAVLAQPEDGTVPNPKTLRERIANKQASAASVVKPTVAQEPPAEANLAEVVAG
jgi:hypothetical protein